jgi:hypothetical protein
VEVFEGNLNKFALGLLCQLWTCRKIASAVCESGSQNNRIRYNCVCVFICLCLYVCVCARMYVCVHVETSLFDDISA